MEINVLFLLVLPIFLLFLQAQIKSRVVTGEQSQDSGGDLEDLPWSVPTSDHCHSALTGHLRQAEVVG